LRHAMLNGYLSFPERAFKN